MMDEIGEGFETYLNIFRDEPFRLFWIPIFAAIITGVFLAAGTIPTKFGIGPHNPDIDYCVAVNTPAVLTQGFILSPILTYISNPPLGEAELACPVILSDYGLMALWWIEATFIVVFLSFIGTIIAHSFGLI